MSIRANVIGQRLRRARLMRSPRLTQLDLAAQLQLVGVDITQVQISKIENGIRPVGDFEVVALATILGVSASWLLGETDNTNRL